MLASLDATVHTTKANEFGIRGFPTIKYFPAGSTSAVDAVEYDGGRTTSDIVNWASAKAAENLPPPELKQVTSQSVVEEACGNKQLCIVTFLPQLLDCQSECRNAYIKLLKEQAERFKKNPWGYVPFLDLFQLAIINSDGYGQKPANSPHSKRLLKLAALDIQLWWRSTSANLSQAR